MLVDMWWSVEGVCCLLVRVAVISGLYGFRGVVRQSFQKADVAPRVELSTLVLGAGAKAYPCHPQIMPVTTWMGRQHQHNNYNMI